MIEVLDDELSLENGFKSSLSKIKNHGHRHSSGSMLLKKKDIDDDIGDLGSPTSVRSFDFPSSTSSSTLGTVEPVQEQPEHSFNAEEFAEKMKTAAILLAQLQKDHPQQENTTLRISTDGIRQKIITEMMALEDDRMEKMALEGVDSGIGGGGGEGAGNEGKIDDESRVAMVVNKEDPSGNFTLHVNTCPPHTLFSIISCRICREMGNQKRAYSCKLALWSFTQLAPYFSYCQKWS